jgi:hypothetical protein
MAVYYASGTFTLVSHTFTVDYVATEFIITGSSTICILNLNARTGVLRAAKYDVSNS